MRYQRREKILDLMKRNGSVRVKELTERFGVSIETIRRDLESLESEGLLKRVYGGAVPVSRRSVEPKFQDRKSQNDTEKHRIGALAASFIEEGDVVGIDLGTTTMELAIALKERNIHVIVITNSIPIAAELSASDRIEVILIGGRVRKNELSVGGDLLSESNIRSFQTDKMFLGVGGITVKFGITDYRTEEAGFRRIGSSRAKVVFALADHSKFGVVAMNHILDPEEIDVLITDEKAPRTEVSALREKGVQVVIA
ncbi:MAG: DeoR/GlpR transcriptional regulator [Lachnospiraceae bacterium]|nr:DeoR/GlpR transcriptional regulator [Lachnospiraceae bacterium]MBR4769034.1 DeoR/GlpR transcriptional regulator [Lachnospiraceae bacterium]